MDGLPGEVGASAGWRTLSDGFAIQDQTGLPGNLLEMSLTY